MQQEKHLIFYIVFLCNTSISYILPFEEIINYQADDYRDWGLLFNPQEVVIQINGDKIRCHTAWSQKL